GGYFNREDGYEFSASETNVEVGRGQASVSDTDSINESLAAYAQAVMHIGDSFRVTGGIRFTDDYRFIDSHNRRDPRDSISSNPASGGICRQLAVAAGGSAF